jgi:glycine/serine hydroxymethyltransferase
MGTAEMATIAELISRTLSQRSDESAIAAVRAEVAELCAAFPPYPSLMAGAAGRG